MKIKLLIMSVLFVPIIGCDRITKEQAVIHLKGQDILSYAGGIFNLTYYENTGGMISLGENLPESLRFILFTLLVGVVLLAGLIYALKKPMPKLSLVLCLIFLAGGFGNFYDRVVNDGRVVDFMLIQLGPLRTGVFNVADIAITAGFIGIIAITSQWGQKLPKKGS